MTIGGQLKLEGEMKTKERKKSIDGEKAKKMSIRLKGEPGARVAN